MLKFNENGKFTIMVATDIHEKADVTSAKAKKRMRDGRVLMETALDKIKPDLVVLLGDIFTNRENEEPFADFRAAIKRVAQPMIDRGIPFAISLGNHDHDGLQTAKQVEMYKELEGCLIDNADPNITGNANYNLLVYSHDGAKPVFNLWFIDSNNHYEDLSVSKYDIVHRDQIEWYEKTALALKEQNGGKVIPALVFQHIPVIECYRLLRKAKLWERPWAVRGEGAFSKNYYVLKEGVEGYLGQGPCTPDIDCGQFKSWKKIGDVVGAYFGHDHLNDYNGQVEGIYLGQCKTASFRVYTDGARSGVREIVLNEAEPEKYETKMYHFKEELGLEPTSLGPIMRTITDRQSVNLTVARNVLLGAGAVVAAGYGVSKLVKHIKNK